MDIRKLVPGRPRISNHCSSQSRAWRLDVSGLDVFGIWEAEPALPAKLGLLGGSQFEVNSR